MLKLIGAFIVGYLVVWGFQNIPNFFGYLFIGVVTLLILKQLKDK
jgi:hypothetical protein